MKVEADTEIEMNDDTDSNNFDSAYDESTLRYNSSNPDDVKETHLSNIPLRNTHNHHKIKGPKSND